MPIRRRSSEWPAPGRSRIARHRAGEQGDDHRHQDQQFVRRGVLEAGAVKHQQRQRGARIQHALPAGEAEEGAVGGQLRPRCRGSGRCWRRRRRRDTAGPGAAMPSRCAQPCTSLAQAHTRMRRIVGAGARVAGHEHGEADIADGEHQHEGPDIDHCPFLVGEPGRLRFFRRNQAVNIASWVDGWTQLQGDIKTTTTVSPKNYLTRNLAKVYVFLMRWDGR